jgi:membrane protein CcdC involved in cytochrome C biogenesis
MDSVTSDRPAQHGRIMLGMFLMAAGILMLIERLGAAENARIIDRTERQS